MSKGKIIFVVGHSNWGKSKTIRELTNGSYRIKYKNFFGKHFFIRRMSNDDRPGNYKKFMTSLKPKDKQFILATLCPNFEIENEITEQVLNSLRQNNYKMFFWVIKNKYGSQDIVKQKEIEKLRSFGDIFVYEKEEEAFERSQNLKKHMKFALK